MKSDPYKKYKSSGVDWLGDVPEHWEVKRLKYRATINDETLPETTSSDYELLYVDIGSVDPVCGITKKESYFFEDAPSRARRIVRDGDTIISTVRTYLRAIAPVLKPEDNLIVSTGFAVIRPRGIYASYLSKAVRSPYFVETIMSRSVGVSYPAINASDIGKIEIPLPILPEQDAIAAFLDDRTGRIDGLIEKKKRLVELLKEKRTALISHAVTKGLNPKAKLKPSGVQWLGDVPEHWNTWKTTHGFGYLGSGTTPKSDDDDYYDDDNEDGNMPWVTTSELRETVIYTTKKYVTKKAMDEHSALRVYPKDTLLFAMYGATIGRLGILGVDATVNQACCAFTKPNTLDPKFTFYWLLMSKPTLLAFSSGGGQPNLSKDVLCQLRISAPAIPEQQAIAEYLDRETGKIDWLVAKVEEAIEKLKEYRTAIISAAVTGKIDVRRLT